MSNKGSFATAPDQETSSRTLSITVMSSEPGRRSNLVDVTYQQLHSILSGHHEGVHPEQIADFLEPRKVQLTQLSDPFGKPNDASRKKIESGSVVLADGVTLRVEDPDKEFVFAVSDKLQIDEVQALVLLRSFLYNEGLPSTAESASTSSMVAELVESITPFYYSERLFFFRTFIPLFRALENPEDPVHPIAAKFLLEVIPDGPAFARAVIDEVVKKMQAELPESMNEQPKVASRWAKQNAKEQLVMSEVLFWAMWGFVPCEGPLVAKIFETGYTKHLGRVQANAQLLLDTEGGTIVGDLMALWKLLMIEVLELETIGDLDGIEITGDPSRKDIYTASPDSLLQIHNTVVAYAEEPLHVCTTLAWAFVLSRLRALGEQLKEVPDPYRPFFAAMTAVQNHPNSKARQPLHERLAETCFKDNLQLFLNLYNLLTESPLFVTSAAWKKGSTVTDPNAVAFRSVLKGLMMAIVELVPVETIPNFEALVEVWTALFGRSESQSIAGICAQYWQADWHKGIARRAIFDVARSRFPIHFTPLVRLLRAMTASGFLDTDTLSIADHSTEGEAAISEERALCASHVFYYFDKLPTFTQIIPSIACSGSHALYEKQERMAGFITYINLRPIKLPGGSTLPARSIGHCLSDGSENPIVLWQHEHSGWKVVLELLTDYVNRRRMLAGPGAGVGGPYQDVSFGRRDGSQIKALGLEDVGVPSDEIGSEETVMHCLDLVRSLIQGNPAQAEQLMQTLETGEPVVAHTMTEAQPPDLVQLTTMILEDALSQTDLRRRTRSHPQLITSAISVLSALLVLPNYSNRVWLYIRSTTALFGNDRTAGFASGALAAERATGHYTMTLALLHLVQQLFREASASVLPDNPRLQQLKEDVLLRAARFVHTEIWVEHLGWKYTQLGDRFEIGRRVTVFYVEVLEHAPPVLEERPFAALSQAVFDVLLFKATTSTINPLVSSINAGNQSLKNLYASRRYGDARRLIALLETELRLARLVLTYKQQSAAASRPSLLEQALCARIPGGVSVHAPSRTKVDPIDVLAQYVKERDAGPVVPIEAARVLYALCASLSTSQPSPPTIVGHLANPEATVAAFVRIVQHPYDDMTLRNAVWSFISLGVDKEPALASLFVTGRFRAPSEVKDKGKGKEREATGGTEKTKTTTAIDVARDVIANWRELWDVNPQLLTSVLRFLDVVWQHGLEHKAALQAIREDEGFWDQVTSIACEEVGPAPEYETTMCEVMDGVRHSNLHDVVAAHAYKTMSKSYAVQIVGRDITMHVHLDGRASSAKKPKSFLKIEPRFRSQDQLNDLVCEAAPSSYDPRIYDQLSEQLKTHYPGLTLEQLRSQEPVEQREFGDNFVYCVDALRSRLRAYVRTRDAMEDNTDVTVEKQVLSLNLNLSLAHCQAALTESWQFLFQQVVPYLRGDPVVRPVVLAISATISYDIAKEGRSGDMMATIHGRRLALLLAMLEVAWFSSSDKPPEVASFMDLVRNVHGIITNEAQPPANSFLGMVSTPFHRILLQIMYFCARHCCSLERRPKTLNAEQRLNITFMVEASVTLVIDALKLVFQSARTRVDPELDSDMELLVAAFEQCTHSEVNPSSAFWLGRCQETDIIKASLDLYAHCDLVGLSNLPLLLAKKNPLYAPHLLLFHMTLASKPTAAERLASDGVLAAYSNNFISAAISAGVVDVVLPELPGERSPAHRAYCSMLSIVAGVISALGRYNHYFDSEICGIVQLYGEQIVRALRWTIGDAISFAFLEEIEQVVSLFQSIAFSAPASANTNPVIDKVLRTFSDHALLLLQQLNYAITHPNHLTSLFEPLTAEEREQYEKDQPSTEPLKRPLIAHLVHRLYKLSSNIVTTLVAISRAESVLLGHEDEWPVNEALIVPHSKVVLGEPASMGTLLELGNCTLDMLRELLNLPAGQSLTATTTPLAGPLDVRDGVLAARRNLEAILVYAVTQLVMWLSKPEFETPALEEEDLSMSVDVPRPDVSKERRTHRKSLTLGERLRRGMTGEMASDLQSLLNKAKPVIAKSNTVLGKESVNLTPVLSSFLQERIAIPT
ncbi:putative nucleoporin subcomplex protein binding to Pom34 [Lyophyllum shimeji]|uniref:Nucleoporin NUP188 n=1 Tax=Lyophyllum shimeji TaxID=47721 RepID=A0A9P3UIE3_LYOSH|nr:putative nucleoporin subcomplex protein binding to Pom34 [Lyophyllum shimeji]